MGITTHERRGVQSCYRAAQSYCFVWGEVNTMKHPWKIGNSTSCSVLFPLYHPGSNIGNTFHKRWQAAGGTSILPGDAIFRVIHAKRTLEVVESELYPFCVHRSY